MSIIERAYESRIRELESEVSSLEAAVEEASKIARAVYKALFPKAVDFTNVDGGNSIRLTILREIEKIKGLEEGSLQKDLGYTSLY